MVRKQQTADSPSSLSQAGNELVSVLAAGVKVTPARPLPPPNLPAASLPSVELGRSRDERVLQRVEAAAVEFAAFESALAARVRRSAGELCMTNAGAEHRLRVESAMLSEQEQRIAREAAARHAGRLTVREDDGGLSLPWEQSLRGAVSHSAQVGNMFTGLYCRITQPDMQRMDIVRTTRQISSDTTLSDRQPQPADDGRLRLRPAVRRGRGAGEGAVGRLVEEAARLAQLQRLTLLGRSSGARLRGGQQAAEAGGSSGGLSELIVVGQPLFEQLTPPPLPEQAAAEGEGAVDSQQAAVGTEQPDSNALLRCPALVLSQSLLAFRCRRGCDSVPTLPLLLHNSSPRTRQFSWTAAASSPSSSPFLLSPDSGFVLPHSSLPLCVSFAPSTCGSYRQTLRLQLRDEDGEEDEGHTAAAALPLLVLTGSCEEPAGSEREAEVEEAKGRVLRSLLAAHPAVRPQPSSPSPPPASSTERLLFTRRNSAMRLHHHRQLMPHWWRLWEDTRLLHRPLQRQAMSWSLEAEQLRAAIAALPARHQQPHSPAADGLLARYHELRLQAEDRPQPHPSRCRLLSSLLSAFASALPPFAAGLRLELSGSRAEQPAAAEDAALQAAAVTAEAEAELRLQLEAESARVLSGCLAHFAAAAQPEGSDEAAAAADEAEAAQATEAEEAGRQPHSLPLPFRPLRAPAEAEPAAADGKAGKSKAAARPAAKR